MIRNLHSKSEQSTAVVIQDVRMDGAVRRPSKEFVTAKMGILSNEGKMPK